MEARLEAYRVRRRRKQIFENIKEKLLKLMPFQQNKKDDLRISIPDNNDDDDEKSQKDDLQSNEINSPTSTELSEESELISGSDETEDLLDKAQIILPENVWLKYSLWLLYFMFWATCYAIAIELKFGTVYLVISALFGIYFNTRTGPKRQGEVSAYSVFNENCMSIDGTLKAEQFEQEIRFGAASLH